MTLLPLRLSKRAGNTTLDFGPEWEAIAEEALTLMPSMRTSRLTTIHVLKSPPQFYPSQACGEDAG